MTNLKVVENLELKGIELYFASKPEASIINLLKENKFRWHNVKKCWYNRISDKVMDFVNSLNDGKIEKVSNAGVKEKKETGVKYNNYLSDYLTMEELQQKIHEWATIQSTKEVWGHKYSYDEYITYLNNYIKSYNKKDYYNKLDFIREAIIHKSFNHDFDSLYTNGNPFPYFAIWDKLPTIKELKYTNVWFSAWWGYDQTNVDVAWLLDKKLWGLDVLAEETKGHYLLKRIKDNQFNDGCRYFSIGQGDPEKEREHDASRTGQYR
jgi:hypothetical protein